MGSIHLFNPLENFAGGSEQRTLELFNIMNEVAEVRIWSHQNPHPSFYGRVPTQLLEPPNSFPKSGTFVFVGAFFPTSRWMEKAKPDRIIIIHNTDEPNLLRDLVAHFRGLGSPEPEILYATSMLFASTPELPGVVQESPIDLDRFHPSEGSNSTFTIGRMSRDVPNKHHPEDNELYLELANQGIKVRIMGGTCLGIEHPNIELLPVQAQAPEEFLRSLDCFFYRTRSDWFETYGRVVFEAMASGLPVVVEARHGYAEQLHHGVDSLLVNDRQEAKSAIIELATETERRRSLGAAARRRVEEMYGLMFREKIQEFYTR